MNQFIECPHESTYSALQVCFLPLMVVNVADDDEMRFPLLHTIASILAWMSAVVNPFIYAFKNRQYQQAFTKVSQILIYEENDRHNK